MLMICIVILANFVSMFIMSISFALKTNGILMLPIVRNKFRYALNILDLPHMNNLLCLFNYCLYSYSIMYSTAKSTHKIFAGLILGIPFVVFSVMHIIFILRNVSGNDNLRKMSISKIRVNYISYLVDILILFATLNIIIFMVNENSYSYSYFNVGICLLDFLFDSVTLVLPHDIIDITPNDLFSRIIAMVQVILFYYSVIGSSLNRKQTEDGHDVFILLEKYDIPADCLNKRFYIFILGINMVVTQVYLE